ncbi:MAG: phosphoglucosamine mutase [Alphaproteobacteria bacterium GM202ARS2]|nr:phosphoglucosamine mutase [Alphaproteobacteria bacterium GM202ARS2]
MTKPLFGTDGIRGVANSSPIDPCTVLHIAMAAGHCFMSGKHRHRVIIGKDTRLSGYMLEPSLVAGFTAMGMEVILVGPMPTPAISMLTQSMRGDLGVMISASHNPYHDNGIKFFDSQGHKLSDALQKRIAQLVANQDMMSMLAPPDQLGQAKRLEDARGRYIEYVKSTFDSGLNLSQLKIVVDCANGATYKTAPTILWELGADVVPIHHAPNGYNINRDCGATAPESLARAVVEHKADLGIALDGDGDRVIMTDENGTIFDGDYILALIAQDLYHNKAKQKNAKKPCVVGTIVSNGGLQRYLDSIGVHLQRAPVGDRHVFQNMQRHHADIGGEASGHILFKNYGSTGDGIVTALQVCASIIRKNKPASACFALFDKIPQMNKNIPLNGTPLASIEKDIDHLRTTLGDYGLLVVRPSGTEPFVRITASSFDTQAMQNAVDHIAQRLSAP